MSPKVFPVLAAGVTAVTLAVVTRAQDSSTVFRAGVDVVHVDVSVLDKDRRPVRGLTAGDFAVLEDGQPREIVAFTAVELPPPASPRTRREEASWVRDVPADIASNVIAPEGRVVVILFGAVSPANFPTAQRIARETVEAMGPGDLGAIVFQTFYYNARAVHDFTSDKARLLEAVNRPFSLANVPPDCNFCCLYNKTGLIADALATIRGRRKSIVYIGPADDPRYPCTEMARATVRKLRAANVTMHEVDLTGLIAPSLGLDRQGTAGLDFGRRQVSPGFLPLETNGQTVQADNAPERELSAIFQESAAYYVIAFASTDRGPAVGQTHDIAVRVSRPDVIVQARSSYQVGQTARAIETEARKIPLVRSVDAAFPRTDLPLRVSAIPLAVPGSEQTTVAIALRVESAARTVAGDSPEPAGLPGEREAGTLYIAAIDSVFATIAGSVTQKVELPLAMASAERPDFELLSRVDVPPGRYEVRAALDGPAGARASVYTTVEVPRFHREPLSLSGVALSVSPSSPTSSRVPLANLLPVVPTARREFAATDRVTAFVRIYQSDQGGRAVSVATSVTDAAGRVAFQTRREHSGSDYQLDLPVDRLTSGEYMLAIEASVGRAKVSRRVRFRIR